MRYDDDTYFHDEEDNDLWDDELDLNADGPVTRRADTQRPVYDPGSVFAPYHGDDEDSGQAEPGGPYPDEPTQARHTETETDDYYSDPEPEAKTPARSRRRRFFGKSSADDEDDEGNDYYDSDDEPEPAPAKKPKLPKLDPEDPDYWISGDDPTLTDMISQPVRKWKWKLAAGIAALLALIFGWIWLFRPYSDNAVKYGYLKSMERRGSLFKTFEGTMIPYKELGDPNPFYFEEVRFSVKSDSLAAHMKRMMLGCVPVRVEYEVYHTPLPWKGEETMVIVKADTADPRKILPPEYR